MCSRVLPFLWIDCLLPPWHSLHRMRSCSTNHPTINFFACLDVCVFPTHAPMPYTNSNPVLLPVCLLGIPLYIKGAACLDLATNRLYISRHVLFYKLSFPSESYAYESLIRREITPLEWTNRPREEIDKKEETKCLCKAFCPQRPKKLWVTPSFFCLL